ncbi:MULTISPECIES: hypothetical protein [Calothrix]|uniref:Uncharacterized protein n=2 Tax=Calothrix TaxID=1186 RepID=A0ABR8AK30_9CYAN|nr:MULTISPECIES: hypothetical protein [Calothrix]MBD2200164.1 hypothetical protein [Calothrix parietina FACHB-288]MBD2229126.1 hypothetical protein [Calothrix anomala FACHB-343]
MNKQLIKKLDKLYLSSGNAYLPNKHKDKSRHKGLGRGTLLPDLTNELIRFVDYVEGVYYLFSSEGKAIEEVPDYIFYQDRTGKLINVVTSYDFLDTDKLIRVECWEEVLPSVELSYRYRGEDIYPIEYDEDNYGAVYMCSIDGLFWVAYQSHWKVKDRVRRFSGYDDALSYYFFLVDELID